MLKRLDAWWTVLVVDAIAVRVARAALPRTRITPSGLTWAAHALGTASAAMFAVGWLIPAALVFQVRFVLDCADGKLARLRRTPSEAGGFLDLMGDAIVVGLNIGAVILWLDAEAEIPALLVASLPASYFAIVTAGQASRRQAAEAGTVLPVFSERSSGGYRGWMAARRLRPLPGRIDVEHALLLACPVLVSVTGSTSWLLVGCWVAAVYFSVETLHISRLGWQVARSQDVANER